MLLTPLEKSKNFINSKNFNNIGNHDGLKKKLPKSAKMPLIPLFFIHPVYDLVTVLIGVKTRGDFIVHKKRR